MRILLLVIAAALGFVPGLATAADKAGAPATVAEYVTPAAQATWTGFYLGAHLGAGAMNNVVGLTGLGSLDGIGGDGLAYGVTGGYDVQLGRLVVGIYGDYTHHDAESTLSITGLGSIGVGPQDQWAVGARAGVLLTDSTLVYALGGYTEVSYASLAGPGISIPVPTFSGYQAGAGIETALPMKGWTLDARYTYSHFDAAEVVAGSGVTVQPTIHVGRVGLNYKLNIGGF